jgi:tetratricopeptide (TPR) repeat protein
LKEGKCGQAKYDLGVNSKKMRRLIFLILLVNFFCSSEKESSRSYYRVNDYLVLFRPVNEEEFINEAVYEFYSECITQQKKGNFKKAMFLLKKAQARDPNNKIILNDIGLLELHLGNYKSSVEYLKKAISIDSNFLEPLVNMSLTCTKSGNYECAISMTNHVIKNSADTLLVCGAYFNRSVAEFHLEKYDSSLRDIDHAISLCDQDLLCSDLVDFKKEVYEKIPEQLRARLVKELLNK